MQRIATRIVELDRGRLLSWPGDYADFLRKKEAWLANEAIQHAKFDKRLTEEEAWLRQGVKARRTRNEGRVKALMAMREDRAARRVSAGAVRLRMERGDPSGQLVFEAEGVNKSFADRIVVRDFTTRVMRGDRIGLIGPNGTGKTTALRLLLGAIEPDSGSVRHGANVQIAYYDQQREQLDPERTVFDTVGDGNDTVIVNGQPRHVHGYLSDFLFAPERARSPVKALSGGERNRLLIARLLTRPANVLVLDEPTNDLDLETLELLESQLLEWTGTLLLVSHDRVFLDNVVTSTLVFEGDGRVQEFVGGYEDWLRQRSTGAGSGRSPRGRRGAASDTAARRPRRRRWRAPTAPTPNRGCRTAEAVVQGAARVRRAAGAHRSARNRGADAERHVWRSRLLQGTGRHDSANAGAARGGAGRAGGGVRAVGRARFEGGEAVNSSPPRTRRTPRKDRDHGFCVHCVLCGGRTLAVQRC